MSENDLHLERLFNDLRRQREALERDMKERDAFGERANELVKRIEELRLRIERSAHIDGPRSGDRSGS